MEHKECRGILDRVFPKNNQGYREITAECQECPDKVTCLREAMATGEGVELRAAVLERAPVKGFVERIKRWSIKKEFSRMAVTKKEDYDN